MSSHQVLDSTGHILEDKTAPCAPAFFHGPERKRQALTQSLKRSLRVIFWTSLFYGALILLCGRGPQIFDAAGWLFLERSVMTQILGYAFIPVVLCHCLIKYTEIE